MDIYLINLERRPDRLSHVTHQLDRLQLPFELFRAIDAQNENVELPAVQHDRFVVNHKKSPVRGEIGCAASHIGVWQRFLETDEEYALVLEDDINIGDRGLGTVVLNPACYIQYDRLRLDGCAAGEKEDDADSE